MIAKQEWFNRRKYTGWGLSPKTWQGWVYILGFVGIVVGLQSMPIDATWKVRLTLVLVVCLLIDVFMAMAKVKLDEREREIEAIAERNASWTMVSTTAVTMIGSMLVGQEVVNQYFTMMLSLPLLTGVVAKGLTHYLLNR
jgi:hypothetical protein